MLSLSNSTIRIRTLSLTTLATEQLSIDVNTLTICSSSAMEARCVHQVTVRKRKGIEEK